MYGAHCTVLQRGNGSAAAGRWTANRSARAVYDAHRTVLQRGIRREPHPPPAPWGGSAPQENAAGQTGGARKGGQKKEGQPSGQPFSSEMLLHSPSVHLQCSTTTVGCQHFFCPAIAGNKPRSARRASSAATSSHYPRRPPHDARRTALPAPHQKHHTTRFLSRSERCLKCNPVRPQHGAGLPLLLHSAYTKRHFITWVPFCSGVPGFARLTRLARPQWAAPARCGAVQGRARWHSPAQTARGMPALTRGGPLFCLFGPPLRFGLSGAHSARAATVPRRGTLPPTACAPDAAAFSVFRCTGPRGLMGPVCSTLFEMPAHLCGHVFLAAAVFIRPTRQRRSPQQPHHHERPY